MEDVGILHDHFVYSTVKRYILWPLSTFYCHLLYLSHFGMLYRENLATLSLPRKLVHSVIITTEKKLTLSCSTTPEKSHHLFFVSSLKMRVARFFMVPDTKTGKECTK
jgi:hypothetical protein